MNRSATALACAVLLSLVGGPLPAEEKVPAAGEAGEKPKKPAKPPATKKKSLYDRIGGRPALVKVVDDFVPAVAKDPKVNFDRGGQWAPSTAAITALKRGLVDFFAQALGGPKTYDGGTMKEVHAGMGITRAEFDALAAHLKAALEKNKVAPADVDEIMAIAGSTASEIIEK